jgi:hypothetical protein
MKILTLYDLNSVYYLTRRLILIPHGEILHLVENL